METTKMFKKRSIESFLLLTISNIDEKEGLRLVNSNSFKQLMNVASKKYSVDLSKSFQNMSLAEIKQTFEKIKSMTILLYKTPKHLRKRLIPSPKTFM